MTDLFQPQQDQNNVDPNKNYLEELVGEGKKFKTLEDLARGKFIADRYIEDQNREMDELREFSRSLQQERTQRATLEEQLNQLRQQLASSDNTPDANEVPQQPQFDPKEIESLLDKKLSERERQRQEEQNYNQVVEKLKEKYGANYARSLQDDVEALGLSTDYVNELARKSPKALFRTLGIDQEAKRDIFQSPPATDRRSNFAPTGSEKRTWSYYQKLKETNPLAYFDPKIQVQMHKDRIALGEAFEDGNFRF